MGGVGCFGGVVIIGWGVGICCRWGGEIEFVILFRCCKYFLCDVKGMCLI